MVKSLYVLFKRIKTENQIPKQWQLTTVRSIHKGGVKETFKRHWITGFVSINVSLTSWGEGASLALVGHPSSETVTIKTPYMVDVLLHQPALHPIFS